MQTRLREGGTQQRGLWRPEGLTGRGQVKGQNDPCPMDGYGAGAPLPPEASLSLALLPSEALLFHSPKLRPLPSSPFSSQGHTRPFLVWLSSESLLCEMRFPPSPLPSFKHLSGSPSRKPSLVAFPCPRGSQNTLGLFITALLTLYFNTLISVPLIWESLHSFIFISLYPSLIGER